MAREVLNNLDSFGIQRAKINGNFQELYTIKVEASQVLTRTNTSVYIPSAPYHPATKGYIDDKIGAFPGTSIIDTYDPTGVFADAFDRGNHYGTIEATVVVQDTDHRFVSDAEKSTWSAKEPAIGPKGTAFNKDFGTIVGTVSEGNHTHSGTYEPSNPNIQTHIATVTGNPHAVTKDEVGLGNVDNTADLDKPISTDTQDALDNKIDHGPDTIDFTPIAPPTMVEGRVFYDSTKKALSVYSDADMTLNLGQESVIRVYNNTGATLTNGKPVYQTGVVGGYPSVALAQADLVSTANIIGITTHNIPNNSSGFVATSGELSGDFSAFNLEDNLYVSDTVAGDFVIDPPDFATACGVVLDNDVNGKMLVRIDPLTALPQVIAYMNEANDPGVDIGATYIDLNDFTDGGSVGLVSDQAAGEITVPLDGVYRVTVNISITFDSATGARVFSLRLWNDTDSTAVFTIPTTIPRDVTAFNTTVSAPFSALGGRTYKFQMSSVASLTSVVYQFTSYDIKSEHIR